MSFIEDSQTIRTKLHLSKVTMPTLVGLALVVVAVLFILFQGLWGLFSGSGFQVPESQTSEAVSIEERDEQAATEAAQVKMVFVHVVGEVNTPGVYELPEGSRVNEAIVAAGGLREGASMQSVNLARVLIDGEQINVASLDGAAGATSVVGVESGATSASLVNINTAGVEELSTLSGIGQATAQKIIADRQSKGSFKTKEDLMRVSGIGEKKFESIRDFITL